MQVLALLLASVAVAMASKAMIAKDFKEGEVLDCKYTLRENYVS